MARATVKDLAKRSGWSLGTVSRVLNGESGVSAKARQDVLDAVAQLGYRRDEHARRMRLRHENRIDIVVGAGPAWQQSLAQQLKERLESQGRSVRLCPVRSAAQEEACLEGLAARPLLMVFVGARFQLIQTICGRTECPAISVSTQIAPDYEKRLGWLLISPSMPAQQSIETLFENGASQIGILCPPVDESIEARERLLGVQYAFYSRQQVFERGRQAVFAPDTLADGYAAMKRLLKQMPGIDGVFAAGSRLAAGALRALEDAGLHPPADLALICMDDSRIASYTIPRLPAWHLDLKQAADVLMRMIEAALDPAAAGRSSSVVTQNWVFDPGDPD